MTKQPKLEEVIVDDVFINKPISMKEIQGLFETVTSAPTSKPKNIYNQIKIYTNGSTYRLYWYDADNDVWHYVTATA